MIDFNNITIGFAQLMFLLGGVFFVFALVLGVLWKIVWHTFHRDIGEVFSVIVVIFILLGMALMMVSHFYWS